MVLYIDKHWKLFLKSFKIDTLTFKLFITDVLFMFSMIIVYGVVMYIFWMKNLLSLSAIINLEDGTKMAISDVDMIGVWNSFILKVVLLIIIGLILYLLLISLYSTFSHTFMNKKKFTLKLFLNFLATYSILTLAYLAFVTMIFALAKTQVLLAASGILICTVVYLYALLIFYLVISENKLTKIFSHGFKSMIRLHDTLPPIFLGLILLLIILSLLGVLFLFGKVLILLELLTFLSILYFLTWLKKYLHSIIHETT